MHILYIVLKSKMYFLNKYWGSLKVSQTFSSLNQIKHILYYYMQTATCLRYKDTGFSLWNVQCVCECIKNYDALRTIKVSNKNVKFMWHADRQLICQQKVRLLCYAVCRVPCATASYPVSCFWSMHLCQGVATADRAGGQTDWLTDRSSAPRPAVIIKIWRVSASVSMTHSTVVQAGQLHCTTWHGMARHSTVSGGNSGTLPLLPPFDTQATWPAEAVVPQLDGHKMRMHRRSLCLSICMVYICMVRSLSWNQRNCS